LYCMTMDDKDKQILKCLLSDARQSARQLSLRLGVSTVTMISRIKKLEGKKIVKGYSARLDHELLGYDITAIIEVKTNQGKMLEIENKIAKHENVIAVYDITGNADTLIIAKFKDRTDLSIFVKKLSAIPNIENTQTHIVLNTIKEDDRLI
jgi:Lrp/AsnC family transcriptional regulator for asnA, asnC and gidA